MKTDLMTTDFAEAFREDLSTGLCTLHELLLSEDDCRARVVLLESLAEAVREDLPGLPPAGIDVPATVAGFHSELLTMLDVGTFPAVEQGLLDADRLAALTRCPDALWRAHLVLTHCEDDEDVEQFRNALETAECLRLHVERQGRETNLVLNGDRPETNERLDRMENVTPIILSAKPTHLAAADSRDRSEELYRRVQAAVFPLLKDVGIELDPAAEVTTAGALLREFAGREALGRFRELEAWLKTIRTDSASHAPPLLKQVAPELFETTGDGQYVRELSYRLFMRSRLKRFARQQGWRPTAKSGFGDIGAAVDSLSRDRIGRIIATTFEPVECLFAEQTATRIAGVTRNELRDVTEQLRAETVAAG